MSRLWKNELKMWNLKRVCSMTLAYHKYLTSEVKGESGRKGGRGREGGREGGRERSRYRQTI